MITSVHVSPCSAWILWSGVWPHAWPGGLTSWKLCHSAGTRTSWGRCELSCGATARHSGQMSSCSRSRDNRMVSRQCELCCELSDGKVWNLQNVGVNISCEPAVVPTWLATLSVLALVRLVTGPLTAPPAGGRREETDDQLMTSNCSCSCSCSSSTLRSTTTISRCRGGLEVVRGVSDHWGLPGRVVVDQRDLTGETVSQWWPSVRDNQTWDRIGLFFSSNLIVKWAWAGMMFDSSISTILSSPSSSEYPSTSTVLAPCRARSLAMILAWSLFLRNIFTILLS